MDSSKVGFRDYCILLLVLVKRIIRKCYTGLVKVLFKKEILGPWMHYIELEMVKDILKHLQPKKCLEWGSGYSTLYFPKLLDSLAEWHSIEHNGEWIKKIQQLNQRKNVTIKYIEPNHSPWSDEFKDGAYTDFQDYIEYPQQLGIFDFILIDGRARVECMKKALELLNEGGVVLVHDANRTHYHAGFKLYKHSYVYSGGEGLWIGSQTRSISDIVNVSRYENQWELHKKVNKIFKG